MFVPYEKPGLHEGNVGGDVEIHDVCIHLHSVVVTFLLETVEDIEVRKVQLHLYYLMV